MEKKLLVSPIFKIKTEEIEIENEFELEYYSNEKGNWCKVVIPSPLKNAVSCKKMEKGSLYFGYDEAEELLRGYCSKCEKGDGLIIIRDEMIKLEKMEVKCTFLDVKIQEAIKFIMTQAGVETYELSEEEFGKKETVVIDRQNGIEALETLGKAFQAEKEFYFMKGVFFWGIEQDQKEIFELEENINILSFNRYGDGYEVETFGLPWIKRGDKIIIKHSARSGEFKVKKIIIKKNVKGFTRMHIFI